MSKNQKGPFAKQLAQASWLAPLLVLLMGFFLRNVSSNSGQTTRDMIFTFAGSALYLAGFLCGVVALFGIRRHGRKGILLPALIGIFLSSLLLLFVVTNFWGAYSQAKSPQAQLERTAASLSKDLPRLVDDDTSLDKVEALEGELVFDYSLVKYSSGEINTAAFGEAMKHQLIDQLCEPMAKIWEAGFRVRTRYSGSDGLAFAEIVVAGSDCGV